MKSLQADIQVSDKLCVVVGQGSSAAAAALALVAAGARIRIIAARCPASLRTLPDVDLLRVTYKSAHIKGAFLVVAASAPALNKRIIRDARKAGALLSVPSSPAASDIVLEQPSTVTRRKDPAPKAQPPVSVDAGALRLTLGDVYAHLARIVCTLRPEAISRIPNPRRRTAFFEALADDDFLDCIRVHGHAAALDRAQGLLSEASSGAKR